MGGGLANVMESQSSTHSVAHPLAAAMRSGDPAVKFIFYKTSRFSLFGWFNFQVKFLIQTLGQVINNSNKIHAKYLYF